MADGVVPTIVQGSGNWGGYVGAGMQNLVDPARYAAMTAAGQGMTAYSQLPQIYDAMQEQAKIYAAYSNPLAGLNPQTLANTSLSDISRQYGERAAEGIQSYFTLNPSARAQDIMQQYARQSTNIIGSSGIQQYLGSTPGREFAVYSEAGGTKPFQANVLTQYQQGAVDTMVGATKFLGFASDLGLIAPAAASSAIASGLGGIRGLETSSPLIAERFFGAFAPPAQTSQPIVSAAPVAEMQVSKSPLSFISEGIGNFFGGYAKAGYAAGAGAIQPFAGSQQYMPVYESLMAKPTEARITGSKVIAGLPTISSNVESPFVNPVQGVGPQQSGQAKPLELGDIADIVMLGGLGGAVKGGFAAYDAARSIISPRTVSGVAEATAPFRESAQPYINAALASPEKIVVSDKSGVTGALSYSKEFGGYYIDWAGSSKAGVGSRMVEELGARAQSEGISTLSVRPTLESKPFWEKMGFEPSGSYLVKTVEQTRPTIESGLLSTLALPFTAAATLVGGVSLYGQQRLVGGGKVAGEATIAPTDYMVDSGGGVKAPFTSANIRSTQSSANPYADLALTAVTSRPGYTPTSQLGDITTQNVLKAQELAQRGFGAMGVNIAGTDIIAGRTLETQRQAATTPREQQFFGGELQKWAESKVELASAYHDIGMQLGKPTPANPYEYTGDLAVEFLKGAPTRATERFSPVSGEISSVLPVSGGLQGYAWQSAVATDRGTTQPAKVSFMPAVNYLGASEGLMGPYGALAGGKGVAYVTPATGEERLVGSKVIAGIATTIPTSDYMVDSGAGVKAPYIASRAETVFTPASGKVFGLYIPVISEALAFVTPGVASTTRVSGIEQLPEMTTLKGTTVEPISGGYQTTKLYETTGGTVVTSGTTNVQTPSGFETFLKGADVAVIKTLGLEAIPRPSTEQIKGMSDILLSITPTAPIGMALKTPILSEYTASYLKGETEAALTKPVETAVGFGAGVVIGGAFRGLEAGAAIGKSALAEKVISEGGAYRALDIISGTTLKYAPSVLEGLYAVDIGARATKMGTDFTPSSAERLGGIVSTEARPMFFGGIAGYNAPEIARGVYEGVSAMPSKIVDAYSGIRQSIPTIEQVKLKFVELREPATAMSTPAPSERFATAGRFASEPIKTSRFAEASRAAEREGLRTRSGGFGTVSSKETPRQVSLKMNYDPLAKLTEIKSSLLGSATGKYQEVSSGIRGTLRGRWDTARTATEDSLKGLSLKERWKAREGPLSSGGGGSYFGSGKPSGTLQSGVGEFGTTVRSGRGGQTLEIRSLSSGLSGQEQAPKPAPLEILPSRRTAARSRAYELEYEYESRRLPEGMNRPGESLVERAPTSGERLSAYNVGFNVISSAEQRMKQTSEQLSKSASELITLQRSELGVIPRQIPLTISAQKQEAKVIPISVLGQLETPLQTTIQRQRTEQVTIPLQRSALEQRTIYDTTLVPRTTFETPRITTITEPRITRTPETGYTKITIPTIFGGTPFGGLGGGGGGITKRFRKFTERYRVGSFEVTAGGLFGGSRGKRKK